MYLPRYWARETESARDPSGKTYALAVWGWSDQDSAAAHQAARRRLETVVHKVTAGNLLNQYGYGDGERPLREPLIAPVPGADALISRNGYGALVLNAARVFIADIDLAEGSSGGILARLFGKRPADPATAALEQLHQWQARQPDWALRVYRTKAGLRVLATHELFDPVAKATRDILTSLGSDPLYTALCRSQACFRARLTPKPWRIGLKAPSRRYPFQSAADEAQFQSWLQRYEAAAPRFAVCRLAAEIGPRTEVPEAAVVVALHDRYACPPGDLALA